MIWGKKCSIFFAVLRKLFDSQESAYLSLHSIQVLFLVFGPLLSMTMIS